MNHSSGKPKLIGNIQDMSDFNLPAYETKTLKVLAYVYYIVMQCLQKFKTGIGWRDHRYT